MENNVNIIELKQIQKCYTKDTPVIQDFNLSIKKGEFVTLLGPSGCGKTTILRMIAGFEQPTSGEILLYGKDISSLPPCERQINTVFQHYALFPHLNIYDNIAFGLRQKKLPKDVIRRKVENVLEVVDLEGFERRRISSLSGGQQQRIAIARAIVNEPEILLLDEPLGALDYKMRQEMQLELKTMHQELGITFVFVTHDQEEALIMSDKIVVLSEGVLQQAGTPEEIYHRPVNVFVADFIGESNIFNGITTAPGKVEFAGAEFDCGDDFPAGTTVDAVIRPEAVLLTEPGKGRMDGRVVSSIFKGNFYEVVLESGRNEIVAQASKSYREGECLGIDMRAENIHIMLRDVMSNHLEGVLDERLALELADGALQVDFSKLLPGSRVEKLTLYDEAGNVLAVPGTPFRLSFSVMDGQLSDEAEEGLFQGNITTIIYKGDHYNYRVLSKNMVEYSVDDEYLWNAGDLVSIVIREEKMELKFTAKADIPV